MSEPDAPPKQITLIGQDGIPVEVSVPQVGELWQHHSGRVYEITQISNWGNSEAYPLTVGYKNAHSGRPYTGVFNDWYRRMKLVSLPEIYIIPQDDSLLVVDYVSHVSRDVNIFVQSAGSQRRRLLPLDVNEAYVIAVRSVRDLINKKIKEHARDTLIAAFDEQMDAMRKWVVDADYPTNNKKILSNLLEVGIESRRKEIVAYYDQ